MSSNKSSLKFRLISSSLAIGILPVIILLILLFQIVQKGIENSVENKLTSVRDIKKEQIKDYFTTIDHQLVTLATNTETQNAISSFTESWLEIADSTRPLEYLQKVYITDNPNPTGAKHELFKAKDSTRYSELHAKYHPFYYQTQQKFGYYDIFLINTAGDLVYSVFKELDYATNLRSGKYANSGLGEVFRQAATLQNGESVLLDFEPYEPSFWAPASFTASPVFQNGELIGVLAFQMPLDKISAIMTSRAGQGETGETYLVGADKKLRSDSFRAPEQFNVMSSFEATQIQAIAKTEAVTAALAKRSGFNQQESYLGDNVLAAYTQLTFKSLHWALVSEITQKEAFATLDTFKLWSVLSVLTIILLIAITSFFVAVKIEGPIRDAILSFAESIEKYTVFSVQLNENSEKLAAGASQQASSIEEISASTVEISSQATSHASMSEQALTDALNLTTIAGTGVQELEQLKSSFTKMKEGAHESTSIIARINDIAFQTNLLALNAAIEAEHAGEVGAGFAVVAQEVRMLAKRATEAAKETEAIIAGSVDAASEGELTLNKYEDWFSEINKYSDNIRVMLNEQTRSAEEQARTTTQVSHGLVESEQVIQENAASAQQLTATAQEMVYENNRINFALTNLRSLVKAD